MHGSRNGGKGAESPYKADNSGSCFILHLQRDAGQRRGQTSLSWAPGSTFLGSGSGTADALGCLDMGWHLPALQNTWAPWGCVLPQELTSPWAHGQKPKAPAQELQSLLGVECRKEDGNRGCRGYTTPAQPHNTLSIPIHPWLSRASRPQPFAD